MNCGFGFDWQKSKGYLSTLMAALVTQDWSQVIAACDLSSWKEALVAALTHTRGEDFSRLCGKTPLALPENFCGAF